MARRARYLSSAVVGVILAGAMVAHAERILHHGAPVEARGSFEECVVCHDGLIATRVDFCLNNCSFHSSHAVNCPYPPLGQRTGYASVETLRTAGITLVDGKVVCISCHDLGNTLPHHLIIDNGGSQLCLTCHNK